MELGGIRTQIKKESPAPSRTRRWPGRGKRGIIIRNSYLPSYQVGTGNTWRVMFWQHQRPLLIRSDWKYNDIGNTSRPAAGFPMDAIVFSIATNDCIFNCYKCFHSWNESTDQIEKKNSFMFIHSFKFRNFFPHLSSDHGINQRNWTKCTVTIFGPRKTKLKL